MSNISPSGQYMTVKQAADVLGVKPWPVRELCKSGELPSMMFGKQRLIPAAAVHAYAAKTGQ